MEYFGPRLRVIAPDTRGFGGTSLLSEAPSIEQLARDVADLLDHLGIERAIIGGCSMGGYVALEFARQFPDRMRALILCDTRADADSPDAKIARDEMIAFARQNGGLAVAERMLSKLLSEQTRLQKPEVAEQVREMARALSGEGAARLIAALRDRSDSTLLGSIRVPTLVTSGEEDTVSPPAVMAQMASQIENAQHVVVAGAGHLASLEQPREWNLEVELWLNENGL